jgi:hypothetical protein
LGWIGSGIFNRSYAMRKVIKIKIHQVAVLLSDQKSMDYEKNTPISFYQIN